MRTYTLIAMLVLAMPVTAQQTSQQLTGHILSAESHSSRKSVQRYTEIQVGNLVYACSGMHKQIQAGKDYSVTIETDKHGAANKLTVTVGEKSYTYRIIETREVKSD